MDMNKEITDFEKHAQKFFKTDKAFEKKDNQYIYDEVVMMWDCWIKQAKSKQTEIDELKEKLEQQPLWVSIDLLKPQYDTDVLVCFSDDDTPEIDRLISGENLDYFAKNGCDVAYWMPLPKLPHEAQEQAQ